MRILTYETTGKKGSAAVAADDGRICWSASSQEMDHLKDITVLARLALEDMGTDVSEVTCVAASIGPGSFTGIRIGVTTARTVGQMLGVPCIAVPTLEGMARLGQMYLEELPDDVKKPEYILTVINARRRQAYGALWRDRSGLPEEVMEQKQYIIDDMVPEIDRTIPENSRILVVGDGFDAYREAIEGLMNGNDRIVPAPEEYRYQRADAVASVALEKAKKGEFTDYSHLLPDYMRKSEAEMRLENGTLSKRIKSPDVITVRRALPGDLDRIAELEEKTFPDPWTKDDLAKDINSPDAVVLTAQRSTVFAGYIDVWRVAGEGQLNRIAVDSGYRGRKIGLRLMKEMISILKSQGDQEMNLEVRAGNRAARNLYSKLGFQELGVRPGYYQDNGEDAVIMKKELKDND